MGFQDPLTIAHVDAELGFSGGEKQVFLLMDGLQGLGYRNVLFCPPRSRSRGEAERRGIQTELIPMRGDLDLPAVLKLKQGFQRTGAHLAHLHTGRASWLGGLAAHLIGLTALTTRRQDKPLRPGLRTHWIYERFSQHVVAISPAVAQRLSEGGVSSRHLSIIPSAVKSVRVVSEEERREARSQLELEPEDVCLLSMASLVHRKGLDVLLDALSRMGAEGRHVLLLAGGGPERPALMEQARRAGLSERVRFLGQREDVERLLAACDIFTLPSRSEGLGVAALEAMASGRPVVASRVGGLGQAVEHGVSGLLVEPEDPTALAEALQRLSHDASLRAQLGEGARARVREHHLSNHMVAAYARLYREVLAEFAGVPA